MTDKKKNKEKDFDPDVHGGGVESFGTYIPKPNLKDEKKDKYVYPGSDCQE